MFSVDILEIPSVFNVKTRKKKKKSYVWIEMITVEDNTENNKSNNKLKHHQTRDLVHFIQTSLHKMYIEKLDISYEG
jgi:hypothetical protein